MITCSNCGAVARPGAKFCTTCGSRLNSDAAPAAETSWLKPDATQTPEPDNQQTAISPSWTWGAPQEPEAEPVTNEAATDAAPESTDSEASPETDATTSTTSWSWNQPATALPESESPIADPETGQIASSIDSETPAVPDAPKWTWSSAVADTAIDKESGQSDQDEDSLVADEVTSGEVAESSAEVDEPTASATESAEESSDQIADSTESESDDAFAHVEASESSVSAEDDSDEDQQETLSSWAARWNSDQDDESEPESEPEISSSSYALDDRDVDGTAVGTAVDVTRESDDVLEDAATDADESATLESSDQTSDGEDSSSFLGIQGAPGGDPAALAIMESDSSAAAPVAKSADDIASGDPLQRARALLAELNDILPTLAVTTATEKVVPATSDTDTSAIATTLEGALTEANRHRFADLRDVLESARSNPRDVDTMLGLVGHVDGLIALLDAHDHLEATIRDAIADLRGSTSDSD